MGSAIFRHGNPLMVDHTPQADVSAGDVVAVGDVLRIAHHDIASGKDGALAAGGGVYEVTKGTGGGTDIDDGELVYFDEGDDLATTTAGGNKLLGICVKDAATTASTVWVQHTPDIIGGGGSA